MRWYDPLDHAYYVGDERWPSVTQVLRPLIDDQWFTAASRERGTIVHGHAATLLQGGAVSCAEYAGYVEAAAAFVGRTTFRAVDVECAAWADDWRVAGRVDAYGDADGIRVVVDFKTGGKSAWHALQVAAYARMKGASEAWLVYLKANGRHKVWKLAGPDLATATRTFVSMLS